MKILEIKKEVKDEEGFTLEQKEKFEVAERNLKAQKHQECVESKFYPYVLEMIEEWRKEMMHPEFSVEALVAANPEEIKDLLLVAAKCNVETQKLVQKLS